MMAFSTQPQKRWIALAGSVAVLLVLLMPAPLAAQEADEPVPQITDADNLFQQGVELFEEGEYMEAHQTFQQTYNAVPLNRSTTAALIMDVKALYRAGAYDQALSRAETFMSRYPTSGYVSEAERVSELAREAQVQGEQEVRFLRLGIAMGLEGDEGANTQDLFHGIRLAVEEDNGEVDVERLAGEMEVGSSSSEPEPVVFLAGADEPHGPVQMIFEDTGSSVEEARQAVEQLAAEDVDVIIGPVFSDEAAEAGAVAEAHGIPFIAPLATDDRVSEGRSYVFQANPSLSNRGREMARYAVQDLDLQTIGIAASEGNSLSEQMAESFQEEALQLGAEVPFYHRVPDEDGWSDWTELAQLDSLMAEMAEEGDSLEGVYLPFTGRDAPRLIRMALNDLDRIDAEMQVLGNAEWHDLSDTTPLARHRAVYTNDFHVDDEDPAVQTFQHRYELLTGQQPERLAYVGYDVTRYVLTLLNAHPEEPLHQVLRNDSREGLSMRFDFRDGNANQALFFHRYRYGHIELLR